MKDWAIIFVVSFVFNLLWEQLHHGLYIPLQPVVDSWYSILFASVIDGLLIVGILYLVGKRGVAPAVVLAVAVSLAIEIGALYLRVWDYGSMMPLVPIINTGLSPTMQLAVTVLVVWPVFTRKKRKI